LIKSYEEVISDLKKWGPILGHINPLHEISFMQSITSLEEFAEVSE